MSERAGAVEVGNALRQLDAIVEMVNSGEHEKVEVASELYDLRETILDAQMQFEMDLDEADSEVAWAQQGLRVAADFLRGIADGGELLQAIGDAGVDVPTFTSIDGR